MRIHDASLNGLDWDGVDTSSPNYAETLDKFVDNGDTSGYQGSSKSLTDPLTWSKGPAPNDKSDVELVRVFSQTSGPDDHVYSDFAIDRHPAEGGQGGTGTVTYDVEYNQLPDVLSTDGSLSVPNRSEGDLWFVFDQQGNEALVYIAGYQYFDTDQGGCKAVEGGGFWCPLGGVDFEGDTSDDGAFAEGTLDISQAFGQGECFTFGVVNVRTRTSNTDTTAFKDYIAPLNAITSNCGSLRITKLDADTGAGVEGAVFGITGDPRPGGDPADTYCVFDGVDADKPAQPAECDIYEADGSGDGVITIDPVVAGSYTVTELVAPPGYLLNPTPPGNSQTAEVVDDGGLVSLEFENHLQWQPLDVTKSAAGTVDWRYLWGIEKQIAPAATGPWSTGTTAGAPLVKTVPAGSDTKLYYKVVVTEEGIDKTDYMVTGTIDVDNPNTGDVTATISDSLSALGTCVVTAIDAVDVDPDLALPLTTDVPGGGTTSYSYSCDLGDNIADVPTTNTASVVWDRSDYPQTVDDINAEGNYPAETDDAALSFDVTEFDETVMVDDDHFDFPGGWTITVGDEDDGTYESAVYSIETGALPGTCSAVITNTATVTAVVVPVPTLAKVAGPVPLQDSESGQVCVNAIPPLPPIVSPPHPHVLPNTGGPDAWVFAAGLALLLAGGTLVLADQRRKRRS